MNDADLRVYSAWRAMLEESERFIRKIRRVPLTMTTWRKAYEVVNDESHSEYSFELGFDTFFLNRTSRSGIIIGAGPIGGYDQSGTWKIDARFNRSTLVPRVRWLAKQKARITLTNEDALTFLTKSPKRLPPACTLFFVDPPYVTAGGRLYLNAMNEGKHIALSDILQNGTLPHWVLTYDDHPLIRSLYDHSKLSKVDVGYSLQVKRRENEVMVVSD